MSEIEQSQQSDQDSQTENSEAVEAVETSLLDGQTEDTAPEEQSLLDGNVEEEETKEEEAPEAKEPVPEEYTADEGLEINSELATHLTPALKEAGITNAQFNKLAKLQSEYAVEEKNKAISELVKQTLSNPLFKGDAGKANIRIANQGMVEFGGKEAVEVFRQTGLSNHPTVVKMFYEIGKAMQEDSPPTSGDAAKERLNRPLHEMLYPD